MYFHLLRALSRYKAKKKKKTSHTTLRSKQQYYTGKMQRITTSIFFLFTKQVLFI